MNKDQVWKKAQGQNGYNSDSIRKDACGAWIVYSEYGNRNSSFGWEIDHVIPESILLAKGVDPEKINHIDNLRPLNWKNNESKADDYPEYRSSITSEDDTNVLVNRTLTVNKGRQEILKKLFTGYDI